MKKIFTLFILLLLLPVTALAAEGAPNSLYVGNRQVIDGSEITYWITDASGELTRVNDATDDSNNWTVKYDPSTATLTLNSATIKGDNSAIEVSSGAGIYAEGSSNQPVALTIELIGTNTITGNYGIFVDAQQRQTVGTDASLSITGDGSLEVSGSSHGIYVISGTGDASLIIKDASVVAKTTTTTHTYSGNAGVYVMSSQYATSSPQLSLTVDGGSLTASGTEGNDGILFYVGDPSATNATTSLTVTDHAIVDARTGGISASKYSNPLPTPTPTGENSSGIVFDGSTGTVYGDVTLQEDLEIGEGESLTIPQGASLDCNEKLTNNGTIVNTGGTLNGEPGGNGTVIDGSSPVSYLDENGTEQSCTNYKMVTAYEWTDGWYVVRGNISGYTDVITVTGDVHLILENNCDLNFNSGSSNLGRGNIWVDKGGSLTIYAQSTDENIMGKLTMYSPVCAGIEVSLNANLIINGGKINATGGDQSAGIGHSQAFAAGTITINGGVVTADGGIENGPGIDGTITINGGVVTATGGNENGHGLAGIITINGGVVIATGGSSTGFGIGMPYGGDSFSTGTNGNAFIIASSIQDQSGKGSWSGVIFEGNAGEVYGSPTLQTDATIPAGKTLTIENGKTLTIGEGVTLTVEEGATLANNGKIINYGTINGKVTGNGTVAIPLTENMITVADATYTYTGVAVTPDVTVEKDGVAYIKDTDYTVEYSDNINAGTAKVTVEPKEGSLLLGSAVKEFTIAKATPKITLNVPSGEALVYDGKAKEVTATVIGVKDETENLTASVAYYSDDTYQTNVEEVKNAGTYYVKASFAETTNYMAMEETASFTITKAPATLSFAKETVSATIGKTVKNTLTVKPEGVAVSYSSSEETVATVDASTGAITLVGAGKTTITATINDPNYTGDPASYTLMVSKVTLAEDEITAVGVTNISIEKNGTPFKLTAQVTANDLGTGGKWEWTSDNETVATVAAEQGTLRAATSTSSATVTPLSVGTATITATYEDNKYVGSVTYTVTVTKPYVPDPISYYNIYVEDVCDGVEVSTSKQVVREGGSITVYVEKDTANYTFDNFKVYYKRSYYGGWEELKEGTQPGEYPIKNIWTHIYIKAEGAEEKEDPTGIESIEGVKVYTKDGSLYVQTPQREQVIIVSMSGAVVKNEEQVGLKQYHGLRPGIYIVRVGDRAYKLRLH